MDPDARRTLIRSIRQRVESLARAGLDRAALPVIEVRPVVRSASIRAVTPPIASPTPVERPAPILPSRPSSPVVPAATHSLFEENGIDEPVLAPAERIEALAALSAQVSVCTRCPQLAATRTQTVFGVGLPTARLMFVGEAPGADEDRVGEPFVGRAGALLTDMITKGMGLTREEVFIANVIKSRPPENRNPTPEEVANCLPYLERQIAIVRPEFLCVLGKVAVSALLGTALPMGRLRGRWHRYKGIPTVVTWHPAYLLRTPSAKKETWDDLQLLMQAMGLKGPARKKG